MRARWWSFVLGLVCVPAEVMLGLLTTSQDPTSISYMKINSSLEIKCSTSQPQLLGMSLHRRFQGNRQIIYLSLKDENITKVNISPDFKGRIQKSGGVQWVGEKYVITLRLSLQKLDDTDLYYCKWTNVVSGEMRDLSSNGTVVIVRESGPQENCVGSVFDLTLIFLSIGAFILIVSFLIGLMIVRCRRVKKKFTPRRAVRPTRPERPRHVCRPQHVCHPQHCPYLVTSIANPSLSGVM